MFSFSVAGILGVWWMKLYRSRFGKILKSLIETLLWRLSFCVNNSLQMLGLCQMCGSLCVCVCVCV